MLALAIGNFDENNLAPINALARLDLYKIRLNLPKVDEAKRE